MCDGDDEYENEEDVQEIPHPSVDVKGKRKASGTLDKYLTPRTTSNDPSLKSVFANKEAIWRAKMAIAHWVYDACIPFNALQSPYFQPAIDAMVVGIGRGFKGPSYDEIRVGLLKDCKKECQLLVDTYRSNWEKNGCTIMADGWTDNSQRTLINFLVYCPARLTFIKSVDASDAVKDAPTLVNLFFEVVEWVGPSNVVHMC
ncbi:DUF659 domain-containing protein [Cephalotus follicularis]|uniref:DUF659 domain-containing protein n=1 Tax=Cephalotus follicularis TaxID=3775 RepID=A0A1Q3DI01_CEPFO|nr:DUF659 domain-containing protein [Cephalotus follicularis]